MDIIEMNSSINIIKIKEPAIDIEHQEKLGKFEH